MKHLLYSFVTILTIAILHSCGTAHAYSKMTDREKMVYNIRNEYRGFPYYKQHAIEDKALEYQLEEAIESNGIDRTNFAPDGLRDVREFYYNMRMVKGYEREAKEPTYLRSQAT